MNARGLTAADVRFLERYYRATAITATEFHNLRYVGQVVDLEHAGRLVEASNGVRVYETTLTDGTVLIEHAGIYDTRHFQRVTA